MDIILPQNISAIISIINSNGHEAYLVGGCVGTLLWEGSLRTGILPQVQQPTS